MTLGHEPVEVAAHEQRSSVELLGLVPKILQSWVVAYVGRFSLGNRSLVVQPGVYNEHFAGKPQKIRNASTESAAVILVLKVLDSVALAML